MKLQEQVVNFGKCGSVANGNGVFMRAGVKVNITKWFPKEIWKDLSLDFRSCLVVWNALVAIFEERVQCLRGGKRFVLYRKYGKYARVELDGVWTVIGPVYEENGNLLLLERVQKEDDEDNEDNDEDDEENGRCRKVHVPELEPFRSSFVGLAAFAVAEGVKYLQRLSDPRVATTPEEFRNYFVKEGTIFVENAKQRLQGKKGDTPCRIDWSLIRATVEQHNTARKSQCALREDGEGGKMRSRSMFWGEYNGKGFSLTVPEVKTFLTKRGCKEQSFVAERGTCNRAGIVIDFSSVIDGQAVVFVQPLTEVCVLLFEFLFMRLLSAGDLASYSDDEADAAVREGERSFF